MEKEEITIESLFATDGVTLIPIARVSLNHWHGKGAFAFLGTKRPVALVIVSSRGKQAFRISGEEISLDQLAQEVPGIKEALERG